jgi:DNA-binding XRE family transcriptional regulator
VNGPAGRARSRRRVLHPLLQVRARRFGRGHFERGEVGGRAGRGEAADERRGQADKAPVQPNNVRKLRQAAMMSKAELARRAGVSPLTIDRVESGCPCRMDTKRKILEALGLKPVGARAGVRPGHRPGLTSATGAKVGLMARHCIGLDIGSTAIKLVQLRPGRSGPALERFGVQPVPPARSSTEPWPSRSEWSRRCASWSPARAHAAATWRSPSPATGSLSNGSASRGSSRRRSPRWSNGRPSRSSRRAAATTCLSTTRRSGKTP